MPRAGGERSHLLLTPSIHTFSSHLLFTPCPQEENSTLRESNSHASNPHRRAPTHPHTRIGSLTVRPSLAVFRRTNCHFSVARASLDASEMYTPEMSAVLNGERAAVHLATQTSCRHNHAPRRATGRSIARRVIRYTGLP